MAWWQFWKRGDSEAEPDSDTRGSRPEPLGEMDINDLFREPPPTLDGTPMPSAGPSYLDVEEENPAAKKLRPKSANYAKVDHQRLRDARARREARGSFLARLSRGELESGDIPGGALVNSVVLKSLAIATYPWKLLTENYAVMVMAVIALVGMAFMAFGFADWIRDMFDPLY